MTVPSIRQLAPLLGISHTMLNRQLKRGKFREEPGGGFDVETVRAALKSAKDLVQPSQAKTAKVLAIRPSAAAERTEEETQDPSSYRVYNRAKAFKEQIRAKTAELDLKARMGEMVEVSKVEATWADVGARVKDEVMALPTRIVNRLPDEWRRQVNAIVSEETRRALTAISHEFSADLPAA